MSKKSEGPKSPKGPERPEGPRSPRGLQIQALATRTVATSDFDDKHVEVNLFMLQLRIFYDTHVEVNHRRIFLSFLRYFTCPSNATLQI